MQRRDDTYSSIISMTSSYSNSYKARTRPRSPPTKRKNTCMDNGNASDAIARRKKRVKTSKQDSRRSFDTDKNIDSALGSLDSQLLADYLVQKVRQYEPDLSLVEIEEKRIPVNAVYNTIDWSMERSLSNLPNFLSHFNTQLGTLRPLSSAPNDTGAPHTLIVTLGGLRAAEITRILRTFESPEAKVAKLFAKHIKLAKAIDSTRRTRMCIGVGTPSRLLDLLDSGALSSNHLERVVVDCSRDKKRRAIFDMRETQLPLMQLLTRPELKERYRSGGGGLNLLFY